VAKLVMWMIVIVRVVMVVRMRRAFPIVHGSAPIDSPSESHYSTIA
jgi:hypothetical protein